MIPNVPLHSMVESSWIVPRNESLESSLFILEQQEKEYNARLSSIANIAAPEPIGRRQVNSNINCVGIIGAGRTTSPTRTSRSARSARNRNSTGAGSRSSYGYTPTSTTTPTGAGGTSRRTSTRRAAAAGATPGSIIPSPIEISRTPPRSPSGSRRRSFESLEEDTGMDQSTGAGASDSFSSEFHANLT